MRRQQNPVDRPFWDAFVTLVGRLQAACRAVFSRFLGVCRLLVAFFLIFPLFRNFARFLVEIASPPRYNNVGAEAGARRRSTATPPFSTFTTLAFQRFAVFFRSARFDRRRRRVLFAVRGRAC